MKFELDDCGYLDYLTEYERKSWHGEIHKVEHGVSVTLTAPDGSTRLIRVEIDRGDLRVRLYPDVSVSGIPAGELILKPGTTAAVFESAD